MASFVYLLHFDRPYPGGQKPQHYLGVCADLPKRLSEHQAGSSKSRLTRACYEKGISVSLVRLWKRPYPKSAFDFERKVKARKESYRYLCPHCSPTISPAVKSIQLARAAAEVR